MQRHWRDVGLGLLALATLVLVALALRSTPAPRRDAVESVLVRPGDNLPLAAGRTRPVVVVLGDSYAAGVGASDPSVKGYVPMLAAELGWDIRGVPAPGGGYLAGGYNGPMINLLRRIDLGQVDPDLVVLQAGHSDVGASPAQVRTRAGEVITAVRAVAPRARVVVVGMLWPGRPAADARELDTDLRAAADRAGMLFANTLDLRFPAVGGLRPTDEGYRDIAVRLRSSFTDLGLIAR